MPFDLSKFSYDAVRAGVIPPLGDCAVSSRRTSATSQVKDRSATSSSNDDQPVMAASGLNPVRQPYVPPPHERQQSEGFQKFLKQHSSPCHNRVTAGGRIVPMEPASPPQFVLPSKTARLQANAISNKPDNGLLSSEHPNITNGRAYDVDTDVRKDPSTSSRAPVPEAGPPNPVTRLPIRPPPASAWQEYELPHQSYQDWPPSTVLSVPALHHGQLSPMAWLQQMASSYQQMQGQVNVAAPVLIPSYPGPTMLPVQQADASLGQSSPQQLLADWEQHYRDLDQQLKNMDRRRAMSSLDHSLAEQRRVIVQQRSNARDVINECRARLQLPYLNPDGPTSGHQASEWNVDAPVWNPVPVKHGQHNQSASLDEDFSLEKSLAKAQISIKPPGGKRPIEIKAPPTPVHMQNEATQTKFLDGDGTEEWEANLAKAPLASQRQQEHLTELREFERRDNASREPSMSPNKAREVLAAGEVYNSDDQFSSLPSFLSDYQPTDLADEKRQLIKAVNLPKGTVTYVRLFDSRVISVHGQGLALPVDDREYQGLALVEPQTHTNKENLAVPIHQHRKAFTDAFVDQFDAVDEYMASARAPVTQSLHTRFSTAETDVPTYQDRRTPLQHRPSNTMPAGLDSSMAEYQEALLSKSYSSVGFQNVHAQIHLPQMLDGSTEPGRSALSQVAARDQARSPRIQRRQHGGVNAWYGPYCRALLTAKLLKR